jgi:hypothetical protein
MCTSGLTAAKLDFVLPVASHSISIITVATTEPENIGKAVEILLINRVQAEISYSRFNGIHIGFSTSGYT